MLLKQRVEMETRLPAGERSNQYGKNMLFSSTEINTNCFEKIVESLQIEMSTAIFNVFRFFLFFLLLNTYLAELRYAQGKLRQ